MSKQLLPVRNRRYIEPRCCVTCQQGKYDGDGGFVCLRDGTVYDAGNGLQYYQICDMYRLRKDETEEAKR